VVTADATALAAFAMTVVSLVNLTAFGFALA